MMVTQKIADRMREMNLQGESEAIYKELYADNARSIEMQGGGNPEFEDITGLEAIAEKGEWWETNFKVHSLEVSEPLVVDDYFAIRYVMDAEYIESGVRETMAELGVYQIRDGKVVQEQFFYKVG